MTEPHKLATQNAPILQEMMKVGADRPAHSAELARRIGRDKSNVAKSIKAMADLGWCDAKALTLTDAGADQLALVMKAEGQGDPVTAAPAEVVDTAAPAIANAAPAGLAVLTHAQISPDPDNARRDWDSAEAVAELDALKEDIVANGLLQNLIVRAVPATDAAPAQYVLVGGERRWRAIGRAIADGGWPADRQIACRLLDTDDLGHRLAALAENLQRRNLNPLEKAQAFEGLATAFADHGVEENKINREIADRIGVTIEHVQQVRSLMRLDEADQQRLTLPKDDPRRLTMSDARRKVSNRPTEPELTREEKLLFAEVAFRVYAEKPNRWDRVEINPADDDSTAATLASRSFIHFSSAPNWQDGRYAAGIQYQGQQWAETLFPWLTAKDKAERAAGLAALQTEILGEAAPASGFATSWLNAPFDLTPEGQKILDDRKAQEAASKTRQKEEADKRTAEGKRWLAQRPIADALFVDLSGAPAKPLDARLPEVLAGFDNPLPWQATEDGSIWDANGEEVTDFYAYGEADRARSVGLAQLIVLSVNTAGGVATPPLYVEPEDEDEEASDADADGGDESEVADVDVDAEQEAAA